MAQDPVAQGIHRLARTLYVVRWVVILGVLAESQLRVLSPGLDRTGIAVAAAAMAVLTLVAGLRRSALGGPEAPTIVLLADIAFVSFIVYRSNGLQSPFYPLYYITVITAAVLISTRAALVTALGSAAVLTGIEIVDAGRPITQALLAYDAFRTFPYLFLIAIITGVMMDRIRVLGETTAALREETARTESELAIARKVQDGQLPAHLPEMKGVEVAVIYKPAREVGGDIYDFYPSEDRNVGVMVADVCGKGVPAALLVASARYSVREHYVPDLAEAIRGASEHISSVTTDDTFVTMTYGVLDLDVCEFRYVNAGGMFPILLSADSGRASLIRHSDPPLGIEHNIPYSQQRLPLSKGDTVIFYTDGLADALAGGGDGIDKLLEVMNSIGRVPLEEWKKRLLASIQHPVHIDDVTAVAIRVSC